MKGGKNRREKMRKGGKERGGPEKGMGIRGDYTLGNQ